MKTRIHAIAGGIGFLTIATFWSSTIAVELFGSHEAITMLKNGILWGMLILIPSMIIVGSSGMSLGKCRTYTNVLRKRKRMPFIALNGMLVLMPCAFFLASRATANQFDTTFYLIQAVEILAGAINLTLMGLNIRDGLRLTGKISSATTINVTTLELLENGPAIFTGKSDFFDENDNPINTKKNMRLCRCGASKNKPFCDGSHIAVRYTDSKSDNRTTDSVQLYEGKEITVHYNRLLCSKASECSQRLTGVFDSSRNPWIDPDQGSKTDIIDVIRECPSGALSHSIPNGYPKHELSENKSITIEKNGPYRILGIPLVNVEGCSGACPEKYTLCRCGSSKNKPFCDGSHTKKDFFGD